MTERSVTHSTFVIEQTYEASPERVFAAWADPDIKSEWFRGPDEDDSRTHELDFRVGGVERSAGGPKGGPVYAFEARYQDIVPNGRIVWTYEMYLGDVRISVSLATVELRPVGGATRLRFTEQGAFLDGYDDPAQRELGTRELLDALGAALERPRAGA
jgi:uncharacterized protein YndB with AHSA1/START domain